MGLQIITVGGYSEIGRNCTLVKVDDKRTEKIIMSCLDTAVLQLAIMNGMAHIEVLFQLSLGKGVKFWKEYVKKSKSIKGTLLFKRKQK
ncbi:MAG TPA: hypothetical protein VJ461_05940 [Candidatus Nanoarchaeia archaeon]|nr:hypothetical protein [Candidatus Nanoarchaeia archaeon]